MTKLANFFSNLMDKFLEFMKLAPDEPEETIESTTRRITFAGYGDELLAIRVLTDLARVEMQYCGLVDRADYCFGVEFEERMTQSRQFFEEHIAADTSEAMDLVWDHATAFSQSGIGLTGIFVHFEIVTLEFTLLEDPDWKYRCHFPNGLGSKLTITAPANSDGLCDARFGRYDRLEIVGYNHYDEDDPSIKSLDTVTISYYIEDRKIYEEAARSKPRYLEIEATHYNRL